MADLAVVEEKRTASESEGNDYVNALVRGLDVIRAFSKRRPSMTLSEVAAETGLTRAAARRFLLTLVRERYAETDGKYFRLTPKILELGYSVLASMDITEVVQPVINDLAIAVRESVFVATLDEDAVVYIAKASSGRMINIGISVGSRAPAYCVSTGRVLLAALPEDKLEDYFSQIDLKSITAKTTTSKVKLRAAVDDVRKQGWSIVDEEFEIGLRSISAPIRDRSGRTIAALNICCPSTRLTLDDMRTHILAKLLEAAKRISDGIAD